MKTRPVLAPLLLSGTSKTTTWPHFPSPLRSRRDYPASKDFAMSSERGSYSPSRYPPLGRSQNSPEFTSHCERFLSRSALSGGYAFLYRTQLIAAQSQVITKRARVQLRRRAGRSSSRILDDLVGVQYERSRLWCLLSKSAFLLFKARGSRGFSWRSVVVALYIFDRSSL